MSVKGRKIVEVETGKTFEVVDLDIGNARMLLALEGGECRGCESEGCECRWVCACALAYREVVTFESTPHTAEELERWRLLGAAGYPGLDEPEGLKPTRASEEIVVAFTEHPYTPVEAPHAAEWVRARMKEGKRVAIGDVETPRGVLRCYVVA